MANWFYYIIIHGSVALVILEFMAVCVRKTFFITCRKNAMASLFNVNGNFYEETFWFFFIFKANVDNLYKK